MLTAMAVNAIPTRDDPRWRAVTARDARADGTFYYSVRTTGVYCRPSCPARLARPENVRFHVTRAEAERAGFRPCKRCRPDQDARGERTLPRHEIRFVVRDSTLGRVLVAESEAGLCAVLLGDDPEALRRELTARFAGASFRDGGGELDETAGQVVRMVESRSTGLGVPLHVEGTEFQRAVWQALGEIPRGETRSYAQIARRIGRPNAVRAVAQACAANRLAVVIPCHRAIGSNGSLAGYRWGVERKRLLLEREAAG